MNRFRPILFILLAWTLLGPPVFGARERCDVCNRRLEQEYLKYDGASCCSQACVDQLRPVCSMCNKTIRGTFIRSEGKIFCSDTCFSKTLAKCELCSQPIHTGFNIASHRYCESCVDTAPTCFSCNLPAAYPTKLEDGRYICNSCMRWSVKDQAMAERHYDRARRHIEAWTGLKIQSVPPLKLVDRTEMNKLGKRVRKTDSPVSIRGLYSRQVTTSSIRIFGRWKERSKDEAETIYIVDHLHDEVFRTAAIHELMHDLIHEYFPQLEEAPLWVQEGICQQAAAEYCRRRNYADILHGIDECPDPDYGDGYRYINRLTGFEGWRALKRWMETIDPATLPRKAPR